MWSTKTSIKYSFIFVKYCTLWVQILTFCIQNTCRYTLVFQGNFYTCLIFLIYYYKEKTKEFFFWAPNFCRWDETANICRKRAPSKIQHGEVHLNFLPQLRGEMCIPVLLMVEHKSHWFQEYHSWVWDSIVQVWRPFYSMWGGWVDKQGIWGKNHPNHSHQILVLSQINNMVFYFFHIKSDAKLTNFYQKHFISHKIPCLYL